MLRLKDIKKDYVAGTTKVTALNDISINFRENEFVSILGPSGCGKTTMLNIIGGLDRYTTGDLIINGKSTKDFTDSDWDTYRNHSIGFVFQSYNLISHQTALANVELALTLSGVTKKERRERAVKALEQVGLGDQLNKKPAQMSGGQSQRVAIARALINNPDIILADEPTGALDSETSVQIMEILKEIAHDKLIVMVTHNPELAEKYSTRIIRLFDGRIIDDSDPFEPTQDDLDNEKHKIDEEKSKGKKPSMSTRTAFALSLRNLITKKARTFLTAFAGSIGIIGIALVLALSNGIEAYIDKVQNDLLLSLPVSIEREAIDVDNVLSSITGMAESVMEVKHDLDKIYVNNTFTDMINTFISQSNSNNLRSFKKYIADNQAEFDAICNDIQYKYETPLNIYRVSDGAYVQVNPNSVFNEVMNTASSSTGMSTMDMTSMFSSTMANIWTELIGDNALLSKQYEIISGRLPENMNEVVLIVDKNNEINEMVMYGLGLKDQSEFMTNIIDVLANSSEFESTTIEDFEYAEILDMEFKLVLNYEYFTQDKETGLWLNNSANQMYLRQLIENGTDIKIVGILRPDPNNVMSIGTGSIGYTTELMEYALEKTANSQVVSQQLKDETTDVLTGLTFNTLTVNDFNLEDVDLSIIDFQYLDITPFMSMIDMIDISEIDILNFNIADFIDFSDMTSFQKKIVEGYLSDEQVLALKQAYIDTINAECSLTNTYAQLGYSTADSPSSIFFYPKSFEDKDRLNELVDFYNAEMEKQGYIGYTVTLTDYIGVLMSSITNILNIVTYVLICFVSISLVVSSIMIGIITYISVLERTKEIGILRAIGASKRDISSVFNAETVTIGLSAGLIGIGMTLLIEIPINLLLNYLTHTGAAAQLPFVAGVILVVISVFLSFTAGLIPSSIAAKKDPVEALRTE
ncbi:MAG TPA: ABC transporter ATP-binding protein/permease [Clostridiales bacterium]|jgi:putative ABC transport system permease protein|nr:ABC transporter ATP-binding protein/permease [Clostridiales bacterium]